MKPTIRVAVTGAAGQIGYALLFRIASGQMFGPDQPVTLQLVELPIEKAMKALEGVAMELDDCAFPLLSGMELTSDPRVGFLRLGPLRRRPVRIAFAVGGAWLARRERCAVGWICRGRGVWLLAPHAPGLEDLGHPADAQAGPQLVVAEALRAAEAGLGTIAVRAQTVLVRPQIGGGVRACVSHG